MWATYYGGTKVPEIEKLLDEHRESPLGEGPWED